MSIMVATGRAATQDVLFRDAAAIENFRKVDTPVVDMTGTLTEGKPAFERIVATEGFADDEVLRLAASLDQGSEHPVVDAIVRTARDRKLRLDKPEGFESGHRHRRARHCWRQTVGARQYGVDDRIEDRRRNPQGPRGGLRREGASVMYLAMHEKLAGLLAAMTVQTKPPPFDVGTDFHIADTTLEVVGAGERTSRLRMIGVGFVFLWFLVGGIAHFVATDAELRIVPPYIPWPRAVVPISGLFELLGAAGLLIPQMRRAAGAGLFVLTIAVTPAHVYMLQVPQLFPAVPVWALWLRLPIQVALLLLIAWCTAAAGASRRFFGPSHA